jgi:hypothetical protein
MKHNAELKNGVCRLQRTHPVLGIQAKKYSRKYLAEQEAYIAVFRRQGGHAELLNAKNSRNGRAENRVADLDGGGKIRLADYRTAQRICARYSSEKQY